MDVSHDGWTIITDVNCIHIITPDGTKLTRRGSYIRPRWHPDGTFYAIDDNSKISKYMRDGTMLEHTPIKSGKFVVTPDGSQIIVIRRETLSVYSTNGYERTQSVKLNDYHTSIDISPTGKHILVEDGDTIHIIEYINRRWVLTDNRYSISTIQFIYVSWLPSGHLFIANNLNRVMVSDIVDTHIDTSLNMIMPIDDFRVLFKERYDARFMIMDVRTKKISARFKYDVWLDFIVGYNPITDSLYTQKGHIIPIPNS
jgi:DNA-binding beta-propeller fold protein YncE